MHLLDMFCKRNTYIYRFKLAHNHENIYIYTLIYVSTLEDVHDYQVFSSDFHMLPKLPLTAPQGACRLGSAIGVAPQPSHGYWDLMGLNEKYWNIIRDTGRYRGIPSGYLTQLWEMHLL